MVWNRSVIYSKSLSRYVCTRVLGLHFRTGWTDYGYHLLASYDVRTRGGFRSRKYPKRVLIHIWAIMLRCPINESESFLERYKINIHDFFMCKPQLLFRLELGV